MDECHVIINREVEQKLQRVRRYVIENIQETPDPDHIAIELDIPRNSRSWPRPPGNFFQRQA